MYKTTKTGIYIIAIIVLLIVYDFYIKFQANPDILGTDWFKWRLVLIILIIVICLSFLWYRKTRIDENNKHELTKRLIQAQEEEWRSIAAELHDSVGQNLTFINNQILQIADLSNGSGHKNDLMNVSKNLIITVDEIRRIMSKIYPHQLERLGFKKAIESLLERANSSTGLKINYEIEDISELLPKENLINLYRIIQEASNNIIKHSEATSGFIRIYSDPMYIYANIEDDGKGIDLNSSGDNMIHYGIEFMKERVRIIGGKINFNNITPHGTKITISIPKKLFLKKF